jgi:hypothetical protein
VNRQDRKFNQPRRVQPRLNKQMKLPHYHQFGRLTTRPLPNPLMQRRTYSQSLKYHQLGQRAVPGSWSSNISRQQKKPVRSFETRQQQQIRMGQQKIIQQQRMQGGKRQLNHPRRSSGRIPRPISQQRGRIIPTQFNVQQRLNTSSQVKQQQRGRIIPAQVNRQQTLNTTSQVKQQQRGRIIPAQVNRQQTLNTTSQVKQQQRGRIIPAQVNGQQTLNTYTQVKQQQRGRIIPAQVNGQQTLNTYTQVNQQQRGRIIPSQVNEQQTLITPFQVKQEQRGRVIPTQVNVQQTINTPSQVKQQESEIIGPLNQSKPQQRIRERVSALHGKKVQPEKVLRIKLLTPKELVLLAPIQAKDMWEMIVDRLPPDYTIPDPRFLQIFRSYNKLKHKL